MMAHYFKIDGYTSKYCSNCWKRRWMPKVEKHYCNIYETVLFEDGPYTRRCEQCLATEKEKEMTELTPTIVLRHRVPNSKTIVPAMSGCHIENERVLCPKDGQVCPLIHLSDHTLPKDSPVRGLGSTIVCEKGEKDAH